MGATLAQGYLYGRPGRPGAARRPRARPLSRRGRDAADAGARGPRGRAPGPGDPLRGEWDVIMVGPHFAAALVARDCGDDGPDADRRFDFVITHDRDLVVRAAQPLLDKLAPAS